MVAANGAPAIAPVYQPVRASQPVYDDEDARVVYPATRTVRPTQARQTVYREPVKQGRSVQKSAIIIGSSAGVGAGVGAAVGGKKGALIGAAIGGGGAAVVRDQVTRRKYVQRLRPACDGATCSGWALHVALLHVRGPSTAARRRSHVAVARRPPYLGCWDTRVVLRTDANPGLRNGATQAASRSLLRHRRRPPSRNGAKACESCFLPAPRLAVITRRWTERRARRRVTSRRLPAAQTRARPASRSDGQRAAMARSRSVPSAPNAAPDVADDRERPRARPPERASRFSSISLQSRGCTSTRRNKGT